jgi:hypothetical protein
MNMLRQHLAIVAAFLLFQQADAQQNPLTRDEVAVIKKKLVATFDALGQPPKGYTVESESFNLPTDASKDQKSGMYYPVSASANRTYGTQKATEKAGADLQKDYEKKIAEAQAKGDYEAIGQIAQEMQQKTGQMQSKAIEARKEPTEVSVQFNSNPGTTIDPDAVLFERPGVIALRSSDVSSPEKVRVSVYFDPESLKDTKQLSRVELRQPESGVARKNAVLNIAIEMNGPTAEVEPWAKRIDTKKVLAQTDAVK